MNRPLILFLNVLVIAACGLIYELLAATLASYLLGDSVTQFSLVIGLYLSALGVGAWLSRYLAGNLARRFVEVELCVALLGGFSAPLLFLSFSQVRHFHVALYGIVLGVGILVGLEIPILMRLLKDQLEFKDLVSKVLTFDYLGALVASILFPLWLVPKAGLVRTSLIFGLLNAGVGLWAIELLRPLILKGLWGLRVRGALVAAGLIAGLLYADRLTKWAEESLYADRIVYARSTPYQRIVVTGGRDGFQLFLNGHLQLNSRDEYRYHEALVHPALILHGAPRRVLVLGGGDGLALREILKYPAVQHVTLVDIDREMTQLSARFPPLAELNARAFSDPRVTVVNQDAFVWLQSTGPPFDAAIVDFPDPSNYSLGKLYTTRFYRMLQERLAPDATVAVQCTSPLVARQSFWCVIRTLEESGFHVRPYHATVPSFGVWGFALARRAPFEPPARVPFPLRFLDDQALAALFTFGPDLGPVEVEINRLDNQVLVRYHDLEWSRLE
jgi:spermidine synthase